MEPACWCLALVWCFAPQVRAAQPPRIAWVNPAAGEGDDWGWSVTVAPNGDSCVTGYVAQPTMVGSVTLTNKGGEDVIVARFDFAGKLLWARSAGGPGNDQGRGVVLDQAGNACVVGWFNGSIDFGGIHLTSAGTNDVFAVKYGAGGEVRWARRFGGTGDDRALGVAIDAADNLYFTGSFSESMRFGEELLTSRGATDAFIACLDAEGAPRWARSLGGSAADLGQAVALDPAGNCTVVGSFRGTLFAEGASLASHGSADAFTARFDRAGQLRWLVSGGGLLDDAGEAVVVDPNGDCYVAGSYAGEATWETTTLPNPGMHDGFILKYDPSGQLVWARRLGTENGVAYALALDGEGNPHVAGHLYDHAKLGSTSLYSPGHADLLLAQLTPEGEPVWAIQSGGMDYNSVRGMAMDTGGNCYLTGWFRGAANFGGIAVPYRGSRDLWVARVGSNPLRPALSIRREAGGVTVSWSDASTRFVLEKAANLAAPWVAITNGVSILNGRGNLTNSTEGGRLFFRLRRP